MQFPEDFPINARWPADNPNIIQLYAYPTQNGVKASIMLEETGLEYEPHLITLADADVKSPEYLSLNPNNKIPAIIDPNGPDGEPIGLFESGAILLYLAEKSGKFLGDTARDRHVITQWLMWQMGGVGPMFGQMGHFIYGPGKAVEDTYARERYAAEARRLLNVLEGQLQNRDWIAGAYSIADIAIAPWVASVEFYGAEDAVGWQDFEAVHDYIDRFMDRPAVKRGRFIPAPN